MKITYIKLENIAGLVAGSNLYDLEIDFSKSINRIISIIAYNGKGKTVLLSMLTPFSGVSSVDDRSDIPIIVPGKDGYKEIHFQDHNDIYIIKHFYKAKKEGNHSVKSYFTKNGKELNENGNVGSFNDLVNTHMELNQDMIRLIRLGSNVSSFISLTPAKRKEYVGNLITEIDDYLKIHKKINDDLKILKILQQTNSLNIQNCHIDDLAIEEEKLKHLSKSIKEKEKERDKILAKLSKIESLIKENDINTLRQQKQSAEISINEYYSLQRKINDQNLQNTSLDDLIKQRNDLNNQKIDIQSKINSYRMNIDSSSQIINRLETEIKKITLGDDLQSLNNIISNISTQIKNTPIIIKNFQYRNINSNDVHEFLIRLSSLNQISTMLFSLGDLPMNIYLKLRSANRDISRYLKEQYKHNLSKINQVDIKSIIDQVFKNDQIIMPNCNTEYVDCPYYRLFEYVDKIKDSVDHSIDNETIRSIQVISHNIDNVLNELAHYVSLNIPRGIMDEFKEQVILQRLSQHLSFFDLSKLEEFLTILREYEIYVENCRKYSELQEKVKLFKQLGANGITEEIEHQYSQQVIYKEKIKELESEIESLNNNLKIIDNQILLIQRYEELSKYQNMLKHTIESAEKILTPLENAEREKYSLQLELSQLDAVINATKERHRELDINISEYKRLLKEDSKLSKKNSDLKIIAESVSTKKGIPVIYIQEYLKQIQTLSNDLLGLIFDDFKLAQFNITADTFEIPYIKNGKLISDVKYASQSELALASIAISFALAKYASTKYNILLLDEIDAGLDEINKQSFLTLLESQMNILKAEQIFVISHNMANMNDVPMDCIKLSDVQFKSDLQNVIYEN